MPGMSGSTGGGMGFNPFAGNPFAAFGPPGVGAGTGAGAAGAGSNTAGGAQAFQNPFAALMSGQGIGSGNQAANPFGFPPMGNNPEMFQQMMQFNQMMRQMEQQQQPHTSQPSSQIPPGMPSFANMYVRASNFCWYDHSGCL